MVGTVPIIKTVKSLRETRSPACAKSPAIRNLIREGKAFQIPSMIQTSKKEGMQLMDDHLYELALTNFITKEDAIRFSHDQNAMARKTAVLG